MRCVFFSGATGGLGECCVKRLSAGGWTVFAGGTDAKRLIALERFEHVVPVRIDVTDMESVKAARKTVLEYTDKLDAVVNFAGTAAFSSMIEGDAAELSEWLLNLNVMGTIRVNYVFFDLVEKGRGRIVNCSSSAGWMKSQPFAGPYVLSKYAVEAYNDSLRRELMYIDVPVIKIQPGSFRTGIEGKVADGFEKVYSSTARYEHVLRKMKPLMDSVFRRSGDPDTVARAVVKALEAKRPKRQYRVGMDPLLSLLELLPEAGVDLAYQLFFKERHNGSSV